ncbi:inversin-like [Xenia sp. Carnegie-2017]|uniref:inversin-like n=1 Tax=Xenia sp. Carnegie-2017 TaxID=2897299 RepID=UPI001F04363D|nr:inversin-like [Xenia sp. Carnegie-2017]
MEELCLASFHTGTKLHTASVNGDKISLQKLLKDQRYLDKLNNGDRYGRTALFYTVYGDCFECAKILLRHEADTSLTDSDNRTLLHWAAYLGRTKFIKLFLNPANARSQCQSLDKDGRTPLHYAAMQPDSRCLRSFLRCNVDRKIINSTDKEQMTALQWSVFYNRLENIKVLLKQGADTTKRDGKGRCLLHLAVLNPNHDSMRIVRILVKLNRHYLRHIDCNKRTSLHLAVANGCNNLARELCCIEATEGSAINDLDCHSRSVLHYAVLKDDIEQIHMLISLGVLPHHQDDTGATVLHYASKNDNLKVVKCLFTKYKNLEDMPDFQGRTALIWAASQGSRNVLQFMLQHVECFNIHASDNDGQTALHFACLAGHKECVKLLVDNLADTLQRDKLGRTALFKACQHGEREIIDILMYNEEYQSTKGDSACSDHGLVDNDSKGVISRQRATKNKLETKRNLLFSIEEESQMSKDFLDNSEWTTEVTETSIDEGHFQMIIDTENSQDTSEIVNKMLDSERMKNSMKILPGIDKLVDEEGCTPLHFAAHAGHVSVCEWLLSQGVNPAKKDIKGRTALHWAAYNGHTECMKHILLCNESLANDRDLDGYSVLHHAASTGQLEAVKLLVQKPYHAVLNYRVKKLDWTPLDFAIAADHQDVTQFLMDNGGLTIAWLQDIAADKIKKFVRQLAVKRREAVILPLIAKHEELQKQEECCRKLSSVKNTKTTKDENTKQLNQIIETVIGCSDRSEIFSKNQCNSRHAVYHDDVITGKKIDKYDDIVKENDVFESSDKGKIKAEILYKVDKKAGNDSAFSKHDEEMDNIEKTALFLKACDCGNLFEVKTFLDDGVNVNVSVKNDCTGLHLATSRSHYEICEYLCEKGAKCELHDKRGKTPLHLAAIEGDVKMVALLLQYNKDVLLQTDKEGKIPLHFAAAMGHLEVVKMLVSAQSSIHNKLQQSPPTPLDCAILSRQHDVIKWMIEDGLQPSGMLDRAARIIQRTFRKWLKTRRREFQRKNGRKTKTFHSRKPSKSHGFLSSSSSTKRSSNIAQSNLESLSRAPDSVLEASNEKDKIVELRHNWERIALLRRKKKAALVLQRHLKGHLSKRKSFKTNEEISRHTEVTQAKAMKVNENIKLPPAKERHNDNGSKNEMKKTASERHKINCDEKSQYKSTFPLISPKSLSTSRSQSPSNQSQSNQSQSNRNTNRRIGQPCRNVQHELYLSSVTSSNRTVSQGHHLALPRNRDDDDMVRMWLSNRKCYDNSQLADDVTNDEDIPGGTNSEIDTKKTDSSKSSRRATVQSARVRRDSLIKNVYGSPAATSFNFALDTYHPLASRRGRKESPFLYGVSSRVRPNSMKRSEEGWVRNLENI